MREIASWINAEEAGKFLGQHAILVFSLVLAGLLGASIGLSCLLYQLESGRIRHFTPPDVRHFQEPAISSTFRDRLLRPFTQFVYRLSPDGHLRPFFTISLFVLAFTGVSFLVLALEVGQEDWLVRFDHSLCASLHEHATVNAVWIFQLVSDFGDASTLASIGLLSLIVLTVTRCGQLFLLWAVCLPGAGILNQFLKDTFQRQRPHLMNPLIAESGWSFPSGHAMCSLVIYGLLGYSVCFLSTSRALRLSFGLLTVWIVFAIGFSRLYLGAHYFSDVMGGYLAATFWMVLCIMGSQAVRCVSAVGSSLRARETSETNTNGAAETSRTIVP